MCVSVFICAWPSFTSCQRHNMHIVSALHIQKNRYWLLVKVLRPNRHKIAHFADALPSPSLNKYSENKIKTRTTYIHNRFAVLFRDYPGEPVPEENLLLDFCGAREDNRGRHTDHPAGCHSIRTNQQPTSNLLHFFLRRMPFLPQPSQFILAWDRHQMLACIRSGLVKTRRTTTEIYNKPRLMRITKFTITQINHATINQKHQNTRPYNSK